MKGCLIVVGIFATMIALFCGLLWFLSYNSDDQSNLTERHLANIVSAEARADKYDVVYSYTADGATYYGSEWFYKKNFNPTEGMYVCVEPGSAKTHAPSILGECGATNLSGTTRDAETDPPTE